MNKQEISGLQEVTRNLWTLLTLAEANGCSKGTDPKIGGVIESCRAVVETTTHETRTDRQR